MGRVLLQGWDLALLMMLGTLVGASLTDPLGGDWLAAAFWAALAIVLLRRVGSVLLDNTHLLLARRGVQRDRAAPRYVRALFEDYAETFERHLLFDLRYAAPNLVRAALDADAVTLAGADVLDVGCGSGLCGPLLKPPASRLTGVDLSPAMLAKAAAKGCYDRLVEGDLVAVLRREEKRYDIVVAADVFVYCGDLRAIFAAVERVLKPGGIFVFTTEVVRGTDEALSWYLTKSGRYTHSWDYVMLGLKEAHLEAIQSEPATLRLQHGAPVPGDVWLARRA
ncbi:MAG: methyltransferase domain-containing protein [Pseudomonadota bacterium]